MEIQRKLKKDTTSFYVSINYFEIVKKFVLDTPEKNVEPLNLMNKSEINELIDIKTQNELLDKRSFLINFIWKNEKLPENLPNTIIENFQETKLQEINNLKQINKLETISEYNIKLAL